MKRKSIFGLIAIGAIVAVTMLAGCVEKEAPASTQAPALTPTPTPSAYILITEKEGGSMLTGYFSTDYGRKYADRGYSFLIQNFVIENHGYKSFTVELFDFYIIVDNVKYNYDASTYSIPGGLRSVELLDGGKTSGKVVFAIPETEHVEYSRGYESRYNIEFKKEQWQHVTSFSGSGGNTTKAFNIKGEEWRVKYKTRSTSEDPLFNVYAYPKGETGLLSYVGTMLHCTKQCCEGMHYIDAGSGDYYLEVSTQNIDSWELEVEDAY